MIEGTSEVVKHRKTKTDEKSPLLGARSERGWMKSMEISGHTESWCGKETEYEVKRKKRRICGRRLVYVLSSMF